MVAVVALLAVPQSDVSAQEGGEEAVVVLLAPFSGELASMGEQLMESAQMAGESAGIRVEGVDEGETVEEARRAVVELANRDDVVAIVGPLRRRHAPPVADIAQQLGIPMVVYSSVSGVERRGDWIFRGRPDAGEQSQHLAHYLSNELELDKVGVMAPRTDYGDELIPHVIKAIGDRGGTVRALARYDDDTTDFGEPLQVLTGQRKFVGARNETTRLSRDAIHDVDALVIIDFHDVVARLLPFLPRAGFRTGATDEGERVQLIGLSGWRGDGLAMAGEHATGAIFLDTFGGESDGHDARQFMLGFRDRTGRDATTPEAELYDVIQMIADGANGAIEPGLRRRKIRDRLGAAEPFGGVTGEWRFATDGAPIRGLNAYLVVDVGRWAPLGGEGR